LGSLAAGGAAFAVGFVFFTWLTHDAGPADPAAREPRAFAVSTSTAIAKSQIQNHPGASAVSTKAGDGFTISRQDARSEPNSARASFSERFAFGRPDASLQVLEASVPFNDRFSGGDLASKDLALEAQVRSAAPAPRTTVTRAPAAAPALRAAARSVVAQAAPKRAPKAGFRLASASETVLAFGYAPDDTATGSGISDSLKGLITKDSDPFADVDTRRTAIYDISSRVVYLPNGRRLEAHSGLGRHMDNPRSLAMKNIGVTPPNVYELKMRESLFHGVRALRLIPKDNSKMYGRDGILAHSYMLGPNGQSNGCVSFSDYPAFLDAYLRGDVTRIVVVEQLAGAPPSSKTAADWFSNTLKDIFRRS
jgi:hypothetical protein